MINRFQTPDVPGTPATAPAPVISWPRADSDAAAEVTRAAATGAAFAARVANTPLVESSPLGYRDGMRHETRPAPQWREPIAAFVQSQRAARRADGTVYLRSYHLRVFSNAFRTRSPYSLTTADIERYLAVLGGHTNANTQRSHMASIRSFYRYAYRNGLIQTNPTEHIDPIKPNKGKPRPAPYDAIDHALYVAPERVRLMIQIAATTGLRVMEIAAVHTSDVAYTANGASLYVHKGKGDKERIVPIGPMLAAKIAAHEPGWLFPSFKGINAHLKPARIGELMTAALPAGVTPHMIRHRFATDAFAHDKNLRAVQELLGHASIATTEIYTLVPDDALRSAAGSAAARYGV